MVFVDHSTAKIAFLLAKLKLVKLLEDFHVDKFLQRDYDTTVFGAYFCKLFTFVCKDIIYYAAGANKTLDNS